jgi:hypothetical protein
MRIVGALLLGFTVAGAPALTYAQHGFGGGGHSSGGGGGHSSGGGGGHFSGGGGGHFGGGFSGGHAMGGPHFSGGGHYFGGGGRVVGGAHFAAPSRFAAPRLAVHGGIHSVAPGVVHPGYPGHPGTAYAPGTAYWHGGHTWYGGYWNGVYWPHVWYYPGYAWWLPVLPVGYATFWWGGVPYYYWNNVYYVWNPGYNGYIVTDPPPVATDSADASADQYEQTPPPATYTDQAAPPAPGGGSAADLYLYPRNGQSEAQQQNDRYECHSWAAGQTGFDPTRSAPQSGNEADYRRAMVACLDARGYSAR